jgi:hypothetical protein
LHDQFIQAISIRDAVAKQETLIDLINSMPNEHYYTLRMLMMHLHQFVDFLSVLCTVSDLLTSVGRRADINLMTGRNLGVVFGRTPFCIDLLGGSTDFLDFLSPATLMRSRDPGAEFSDMAGKALFIEWLVENAPAVFRSSE